MKKITLVFVCIVLVPALARAQSVHIDGQQTLTIAVGAIKDGHIFNVSYGKFLSNRVAWQVTGSYQTATFTEDTDGDVLVPSIDITSDRYLLSGTAHYTLFELNQRVFAGLYGGITTGYEILNDNQEEVDGYRLSDTSQFLYGLKAGVEIETYFTASLAILVKAGLRYHQNAIGADALNLPLAAGLKIIL